MKLPPKVHIKSGRYYLVHKNRWHGLTRVEAGETALRQALAAFQNPAPRTVDQLIDAWLATPSSLAPKTQKEYAAALERIRAVFGRVLIGKLDSGMVSQYLARRGGVKANREMAALSSVYSWAMRQGFAVDNPCHGVRRNPEKPRDRYISNLEFGAALRATTPAARDLMLAAYFTGLRQGDLRKLTAENLGREGILLTEGKGQKRVVVVWSPPLRKLVDRARSRSRCNRVFTNCQGEPWSLWAVQSFMRRLQVDWNFHDIRAKAESDHATGMGLLSRYKRARRITPTR
jgi:site-specific recombinase XerD